MLLTKSPRRCISDLILLVYQKFLIEPYGSFRCETWARCCEIYSHIVI